MIIIAIPLILRHKHYVPAPRVTHAYRNPLYGTMDPEVPQLEMVHIEMEQAEIDNDETKPKTRKTRKTKKRNSRIPVRSDYYTRSRAARTSDI